MTSGTRRRRSGLRCGRLCLPAGAWLLASAHHAPPAMPHGTLCSSLVLDDPAGVTRKVVEAGAAAGVRLLISKVSEWHSVPRVSLLSLGRLACAALSPCFTS